MSTKSTPGSFRCYEAALPDEPMFVILGRDPAGPATLHFWAQERIKQGKTKEIDDNARIGACLRESEEMAVWRTKIMDHAEEMGEPPAWKLPRPRDEPGDRPLRMEPALGMPYTPDLTAKIANGLRQVTGDMKDWLGDRGGNERTDAFLAFMDRLNGYAAELEAAKGDPYEALAEHLHGAAAPTPPVAEEPRQPVSRDVTEIDEPELPPHRFAMFDKGRGWAYGRGLEINPTHIPAMLDRMEADGYTLVAALGSQADKVGMIFQRGPRYSTFELAHGFGGGFSRSETEKALPSGPLRAYQEGKSFAQIAEEECPDGDEECLNRIGLGRGQMP